MENSGAEAQRVEGSRSDSADGEEYKQIDKNGEFPAGQHPRRPNLSTLLIPARSMESPCPSSTRINIASMTSPSSTRAGLPPRPNSAKGRPSMRSMLPQRSFKGKTLAPECEKTVLLIPGTPTSEEPQDKPSNSRSFSLTKVFSSTTTKRTYSLPVTPVANSGPEPAQGSDAVAQLNSTVFMRNGLTWCLLRERERERALHYWPTCAVPSPPKAVSATATLAAAAITTTIAEE